ncbi:MAG TPA: DUF11 domain-containing protein [Verrucomicrobiae bacterium]|nr:DUF11 domain-containing protein [Verrucomicrobiae bacterium]
MKFPINFRALAIFLAAFVIGGARAYAQGFGLLASSSASSILVSNSVTYTINVTNFTGIPLADAMVTNTLPASVEVSSASTTQGSYAINGSVVLFDLGQFSAGGIAQLTVTAEPTAAGFITNAITVISITVTNTASTNVVVQVTNAVIQADLGVTITGPVQAVITNDWMTYGVSVTNSGPNAASNVTLTNTLPPGVILKGVSPAKQPYTVASSNLIFNLGMLADGGYTNLQFTVQPTNAGVLTFSASVGAAGVLDTNTANNFASTNITIIDYLPGALVAVTNSAQTINLQNGLTEQSILLSNIGASGVPAARVVVTGLTNQLFNAVGTNNGSPFVYYGAPLAVGQSVNLLLQYSPRGFFPFTNGQLQAFAVPLPDWTPPPVSPTGANLNISRIVTLTNGDVLIEWPAITNRIYTVVYSDNASFSNAMIAPPAVVAPANRVQWIDYGPPATVSAPTNSSARFYRVFLSP